LHLSLRTGATGSLCFIGHSLNELPFYHYQIFVRAQVMSVLGFKRVILEDTRESAMFLAFDADEEETRKTVTAATESETSALAASEDASTSTSAAALAEAWAWLNKQLDACLLMRGAAKPQATCCAECTLQVRKTLRSRSF
jgi:hypothetical protein